MVRYADDLVVGFEHQTDAKRFLEDMRARPAEFTLTLHPGKTGSLTQRYVKRQMICQNTHRIRLLTEVRSPSLAALFGSQFCEAGVQSNRGGFARSVTLAGRLEIGPLDGDQKLPVAHPGGKIPTHGGLDGADRRRECRQPVHVALRTFA